jgi:hypothetical protein
MYEVLDFRAIAQYARPLAAAHAVVRPDDIEGIGGAVMLTLAVDGRVAHHNIIETPFAVGIAAELLADDLAGTVKDGGAPAEWKGVLSINLPAMPGP